MGCDIVLGGQWGDEGKAKIVDHLSDRYDVIVRYQGGANAGHTVFIGKEKYVFHLIPSGILNPDNICVLGNGVVIDPGELLREILELERRGISSVNRLKISSQSFVVLPFHKEIDTARDDLRQGRIGTTGRGIGPAYSDKINRLGVRIADMGDRLRLRGILEENLKEKKVLYRHLLNIPDFPDIDAILKQSEELYASLSPYIANTPYLLNGYLKEGKKILFEGAQGTGLDVDFGSYPYVTSSSSSSGGAATGSGLSVTAFDKIIGVFKLYITRVGEGSLPTLLNGRGLEIMRQRGREYGSTTGRPRNCGWFDGIQARYASMINGMTGLALTKLDILDHFETIRFCTAYEIDGRQTTEFPISNDDLARVYPIYKEFPGWNKSTRGITDPSDLPKKARLYIDFLETYLDVPIRLVSTGPERHEVIPF